MTIYKHTQIGYLMIWIIFIFAIFYSWLSWVIIKADQNSTFVIGIMVLVLIILSSFSTLQVLIDEKYVKIKFGFGIYKKSFPLDEIQTVQRVRNHWYYGWGIKIWTKPYMIIFSVSGLDAVEIILKNGKRYRIGTDEPEKLERIISQVII